MKAVQFRPTSSITLDEFASLLMDDTDLLPETRDLLSTIFHFTMNPDRHFSGLQRSNINYCY
ncbi:hypothetical protein BIY27_16565 [Gibbsiella quercinecans]|uniref:hypothetical protein n=1 Tax=Gibbsiella quercinecans TaxID=929813 RepID=UPI000EF17786|nr:hypothetical protein [Gibbsiella quercinecans]RLM08939.1 hypothetical protein BIY27_16565 [Gibbsiella quercinecans]